jgi:DnaK suppressor protein
MDEKKLEQIKGRLLEKKLSLADMVVRTAEYGREKEPAIQDVADMAVASYTKEFMFGRSSGDRAMLQMINEALERIEEKTYGICVNCDEPIQPKRLEAVPWAVYCLRCQGLQEKGLLNE